MTFGIREGVIVLIVVVAVYMAFVVLRMRRLHEADEPDEPDDDLPVEPAAAAFDDEPPVPRERVQPSTPHIGSERLADSVLIQGLEQELAQLREEVDALRAELAGMRTDMHKELTVMRASQTVSPIYGDAMQLAISGYTADKIAERCGIARAEAELVVALARSREEGAQ